MANLMLDELASHLEAQGFGTTAAPAPSIQIGRLQHDPSNVIVLDTSPGRMAVRTMGNRVIYDIYNVEIIVRDEDQQAGEIRAMSVYNALDFFQGTINGTTYHLIECVGPPYFNGVDENRRSIFHMMAVVRRERRL